MICPQCHSENRTGARFCDVCGNELPSVAYEATQMFGSDSIYVNNGSNISINLEGLEQMIDSSYDPQSFERSTTADLNDSFASFTTEPLANEAPYDPYYDDNTRVLAPQAAMTQAIPAVPLNTQAPLIYSDETNPDASKRKGKKPLIIGLVSALVIVAFLAIAYLLQFWGGATVPDVVGMDKAEATKVLEDAGFEVTVVDIKSDDVEGIVLSTNPEGLKRAELGSAILLNVSVPRTIPDILGMNVEEASSLLVQEGFTNVEYVDAKSNEEAGSVVGVEPSVGTRSKADSKVVVQVAIPHVVPDVAGKTSEEARAALEEEGYVVEVAYLYTEDVADGQSVSTDPAAGAELASGSKVVLNLAKNRSREIESLARAYFDAINTFRINGQDYEMRSISSLRYAGDNKCAFTIIARPFETHSWFGVEMETRYGNDETINGTMTYNDQNQVIAIDPAIKQGG